MSESIKSGVRRLAPVWLAIASLLVLELAVRFMITFELRRVLLVEAVSFLAVGAFLYAYSRKRPDLSRRTRIVLIVSSSALLLGAIRSGLWWGGLDVQWANITILVVGLLMFAFWRWSRRAAAANP